MIDVSEVHRSCGIKYKYLKKNSIIFYKKSNFLKNIKKIIKKLTRNKKLIYGKKQKILFKKTLFEKLYI